MQWPIKTEYLNLKCWSRSVKTEICFWVCKFLGMQLSARPGCQVWWCRCQWNCVNGSWQTPSQTAKTATVSDLWPLNHNLRSMEELTRSKGMTKCCSLVLMCQASISISTTVIPHHRSTVSIMLLIIMYLSNTDLNRNHTGSLLCLG